MKEWEELLVPEVEKRGWEYCLFSDNGFHFCHLYKQGKVPFRDKPLVASIGYATPGEALIAALHAAVGG